MPRPFFEEVYLTRQFYFRNFCKGTTAGVPFDLPILSPALAAFGGFSCQLCFVNRVTQQTQGESCFLRWDG